ncbi:MAG: acyltransferase [Deltaproteobacteria bacterium]|nr:acyltransferase [Deltaproteobacteria bacterium]
MSTLLTPQVKKVLKSDFNDLMLFTIGCRSFTGLVLWEVFELFLKGIRGLSGILLRRWFARCILGHLGKGCLIEDNVSFLGSRNISLGNQVIIRRNSSLEARFGGKIKIGSQVLINQFTTIVSKRGQIEIDDGVNISSHCRIASTGFVKIGKSVLISSHVYVGAPNHSLSSVEATVEDEVCAEGVVIEDNVWIGSHCTILDGVTIRSNSVIGAHSFVNRDVPPNTIAFGVPARPYRER